MAFLDYYMELKGTIPSLPVPLAQTIVNRAWQDIQKTRFWSFLRGTTTLLVPTMISTGTVAVTQFLPTVQCDATTKALLNAATLPLITQRQFRTGFGNPIYSIWGYDNATGILTLDRPFTEPTNAASAYVVYRAFFVAPVVDFKRWESITNLRDSYPLELNHTRQEVENIDPQRSNFTSDPYWVTAYQTDNNQNSPSYRWPMFELYPHATSALGLVGTYHRYGTAFTGDTDDVILPVTPEMLMTRARYLAYEFAESNKGRVVELRGSNWPLLMQMADVRYKEMLRESARLDEEIYLTDFVSDRSSGLGFLHDANWEFNH